MERGGGRGSGIGVGGGRKWAIEFSDATSLSSITKDVQDPPGFSRSSLELEESKEGRQKKELDANWKQQGIEWLFFAKKAWEVAQAPFKNLFMMGFMMWMAGSTVHLFSIGITFSALWQPISALQGIGKTFEPYKDARTDVLLPKLLFTAMNFAALGLGLWKLNSLGLLPTHASDWVSSLLPSPAVEFSGGGLPVY